MASFTDRVMETSTTTGTGDLTLAGAVTGFRTCNAAFGTNVFFYYAVESVDGSGVPTGDWETGKGYLSGSTTFVRSEVRASSNADAAVNFSAGTKRVSCQLIASEALPKGVVYGNLANLSR